MPAKFVPTDVIDRPLLDTLEVRVEHFERGRRPWADETTADSR
jgi:hypothetical protein